MMICRHVAALHILRHTRVRARRHTKHAHRHGDPPPYYDPTFETYAQEEEGLARQAARRDAEAEQWPAANAADLPRFIQAIEADEVRSAEEEEGRRQQRRVESLEWVGELKRAGEKPWNVWGDEIVKRETEWAQSLKPMSWSYALHAAAGTGDIEGIRRVVYQQPERLCEQDHFGYTALHTAVESSQVDAAECLIGYMEKMQRKGLNVTNNDKRTALHLAVVHDEVRMSERLLGAKAAVDTYDGWGETPLLYAAAHRRTDLALMLLQVERMCMSLVLVLYGQRLAPVLGEQCMPLEFGWSLITMRRPPAGNCPAPHRLCVYVCVGVWVGGCICKAGGKAGSEAKGTRSMGETPLHWACKRRDLALARALLEAGAKREALDDSGLRPSDWARADDAALMDVLGLTPEMEEQKAAREARERAHQAMLDESGPPVVREDDELDVYRRHLRQLEESMQAQAPSATGAGTGGGDKERVRGAAKAVGDRNDAAARCTLMIL